MVKIGDMPGGLGFGKTGYCTLYILYILHGVFCVVCIVVYILCVL